MIVARKVWGLSSETFHYLELEYKDLASRGWENERICLEIVFENQVNKQSQEGKELSVGFSNMRVIGDIGRCTFVAL